MCVQERPSSELATTVPELGSARLLAAVGILRPRARQVGPASDTWSQALLILQAVWL